MEPREIIDQLRRANSNEPLLIEVLEAAREYVADTEANVTLREFGKMVHCSVRVEEETYSLGFFMDREIMDLLARAWTRYKIEHKEEKPAFWFREAKSYPLIQDKMRNWTF